MKRSKVTRRSALSLIVGATVTRAFAAQDDGVPPDQTAFVLLDAASGTVLDAHRASEPQIPASLAKLFTMAAAKSLIVPAHSFTTRLFGSAQGLALDGGGDPQLDIGTLGSLSGDAYAAGFRRVDDFRVTPGSWPRPAAIECLQPAAAPYNPGIARLAIAFNRARIVWHGRVPSAVFPGPDEIPADTLSIDFEDGAHPAWSVGRDGAVERWFLPGAAKGEIVLPIGDPVRAAALALRRVAAESNLVLPPPVVTAAIPSEWPVVAAISSPPIEILMRDCLRYSTNVTAEMIGLAATERLSLVPPRDLRSSAAALRDFVMRRNPRIDWRGFDLHNHSGLTSASRASALHCAQLLAQDAELLNLLSPWPKDAPPKIRAKTGTMAYVRGIAGGFETAKGARVFAILSQDLAARSTLDALQPAQPEIPEESRKWLAGARRLERSLLAKWGAPLPDL